MPACLPHPICAMPRGFICKLSDFGLVTLLSTDGRGGLAIEHRAATDGTATHMAPEVISSGE